jgi:excisionase family DNA binding protein
MARIGARLSAGREVQEMPERLLTPEDVADRLQISPKTVRDMLRDGRLKGIKMGKLWRIREADLDAFIRGHSEQES